MRFVLAVCLWVHWTHVQSLVHVPIFQYYRYSLREFLSHTRFVIVVCYQVHGTHVQSISPLVRVPHVNLVTLAVMEPMHLFDGGAVKFFTDVLTYSPAARHACRLATSNGHRLAGADMDKLNEVILFFRRITVVAFPRRLR